ncbi:MAG: proline dehydrogenase family protein [Marinilabiliales bacterium]|nr:proline dehydrogenase family protein [Marinilabiliales bacterium]
MINRMIAGVLPYMPKKLIWIFSKKYIAGEYLQDALRESVKLNKEGSTVTIDILGEYIHQLSEAVQYKEQYIQAIEFLLEHKVKGNFSLKPSMFGLLLDKEACYENIREILRVVQRGGSFVRIDMEDSTCTDDEISLYLKLKDEFPGCVGLVVQAYLKRTLPDLRHMVKFHTEASPLNFRLCKGIYVESGEIAYKEKQEIRDRYLEDLAYLLRNGVFVGIATHDTYLVEHAMELIEQLQIPHDRYEFQMLFGVAPKLRRSILARGHAMKVYVPFGKQWFGYSTRRLKENPNMVWDILKALVVRN